MSKPLFGAMAMFYAVTSGAGGGGSLTPPAAIIGAVPQLNFSDVANTGGYLQNSAAAGTILTDGAYYDGAAWIPKDTGAVVLQMNGALAGFVMYVNTSLTPGTPFTPTMVYQYLGAGSNVDFAPPVGATGGVVVSGGSLPTTGDSLSITKTNITSKNWTAGTYNAVSLTGASWTLQTSLSGTAIDGSFQIGSSSAITHTHASQTGAQESFYLASVADDATAKYQLKNGTSTDAQFVPNVKTTGGAARQSLISTFTITTDTGTIPCYQMVFDVGGSNPATRPLWSLENVSGALTQVAADGSQYWLTTPASLTAGQYVLGGRRSDTATSGNRSFVMFEGFGNPAGASSASFSGVWGYGTTATSNAQNFTATVGIVGVRASAEHRGTATVTGLAAIRAQAATNSGGGTVTNNYGVYVDAQTVGTNNYTLYGAGGIIDNVGIIRAQGNQTPPAGVGCEMSWTGSDSVLRSYDRGGASYQPLRLDGSVVSLRPGGTAAVTVTGSSATYGVGINYRVTLITAAGPTTLAGDDHVGWNPTVSAAGQINLVAAPATGQEVTIQDIKGIAAANNLTISGNGKNINGGTTATTEVIATNFGSRTLWYDGTQWNIKAKV